MYKTIISIRESKQRSRSQLLYFGACSLSVAFSLLSNIHISHVSVRENDHSESLFLSGSVHKSQTKKSIFNSVTSFFYLVFTGEMQTGMRKKGLLIS